MRESENSQTGSNKYVGLNGIALRNSICALVFAKAHLHFIML